MSSTGEFWLLAQITPAQVPSFDWHTAANFCQSAVESARHKIPLKIDHNLNLIALHDGKRVDAKTGLAQVNCAICDKVLLLGLGPLEITTLGLGIGRGLIAMYSCSGLCRNEADKQIRKLQLGLVTHELEETTLSD